MKKSLLLLATLSAFAIANPIANISDQKNWKDDQIITVQGKITQTMHDDKYQFTDATGSITIEIDDEHHALINQNRDAKLKITGEVDLSNQSIEIDVDHIEVLN